MHDDEPVPDVEVTARIAAPATTVYDLVSDVTAMGRWSPETTSCRWLDGATGPQVGARFRGTNRHGLLRWETTCTVTAAEPGRRFAFDVTAGPLAISEWCYDFTDDGDGCVVTETWTDRRTIALRVAAVPVMRVRDRAAHNRRNMQATLAALRAAAERAQP